MRGAAQEGEIAGDLQFGVAGHASPGKENLNHEDTKGTKASIPARFARKNLFRGLRVFVVKTLFLACKCRRDAGEIHAKMPWMNQRAGRSGW
jgi:hypothetical protein